MGPSRRGRSSGSLEASVPFQHGETDASAAPPRDAPPASPAPPEDDDWPPFDPPDEEDLVVLPEIDACHPPEANDVEGAELQSIGAQPAHGAPRALLQSPLAAPDDVVAALPTISIDMCWDRPAAAEALSAAAASPALSRACIAMRRGGMDAAILRASTGPPPDLFILDTTLRPAELLAGVERLAPAIEAGAKVVVIGAANDVCLLRALSAAGVSEYLMPPLSAEQIVRAACRLFASTDRARVVAVIGARGGVGASSTARNVAWSLAKHGGALTSVLDLDLAFGGVAAGGALQSAPRLTDLAAEEFPERLARSPAERLFIWPAPGALDEDSEPDAKLLNAAIVQARRASQFVILDLPHRWSGWVERALAGADDVLIVAAPDLASLRNSKNMIDRLSTIRHASAGAPQVILSMVGAPGRPEIAPREFGQAVGQAPAASIPFDPGAYGEAEEKQAFVADIAPLSKAACVIETLAASLAAASGARACRAYRDTEKPLLLDAPFDRPAGGGARAEFGAKPRRSLAGLAACLTLAVALLGWQMQSRRQAQAGELPQDRPPAAATSQPEQDGLAPLMRAAERGAPAAQYRLAGHYERGEGVPVDLELARLWTERAATGGNISAMHDLGVYFARGEGGAGLDAAAAFRWFRQAAAHGVADSQFNLGVFYRDGRGVAANTNEALFWFLLAAEGSDHPELGEAISVLEAGLTAPQREAAHARARAFVPSAPDPVANPGVGSFAADDAVASPAPDAAEVHAPAAPAAADQAL